MDTWMTPFSLPSGYARIQLVSSFEELAQTPLSHGVNALCWPRTLEGDFAEVVAQLRPPDGITRLDEEALMQLELSAAGRAAVQAMVEDLWRLKELGTAPELNCIKRYPQEENPGPVRTDVYSFHADSAMEEADTWLCTYHGAPSEGLQNEEACLKVAVPEIRAALLAEYGGVDDDAFLEFLADHCYDLHYAGLPHARPFSFGTGNLWRIAVDYPESDVPPCIHRAPQTAASDPPRLLLIS